MAHLRGPERAEYVERMFSRISRRYDLMNTMMTGGMHYRWRRLASRMAASHAPGPVLDVATGTGDFVVELARLPWVTHAIGLDFSGEMLFIAREKARRKGVDSKSSFLLGDALTLPFRDESFATVTSGFSLRNVIDVSQALREMARVTRPGGRLAILEITPMAGRRLSARLFRFYFESVVPWIGALVAGDREAYTYLPESVEGFPDADALAQMIENAGWRQVSYRKLGMGGVAIHTGAKQ